MEILVPAMPTLGTRLYRCTRLAQVVDYRYYRPALLTERSAAGLVVTLTLLAMKPMLSH